MRFPLQPKDQLCNKLSSVLTFNYVYDASAGAGVRIFIVGEFQRGIMILHQNSPRFQTLVRASIIY